MNRFGSLLRSHHVALDAESETKTAVLMKISTMLAGKHETLVPLALFEQYCAREKLGSTAIGRGIAIPHIRSVQVQTPAACFLKLHYPVDFGAEDKRPVDLLIGLLVPENNPALHLQLLQTIVTQFQDPALCRACRAARDTQALYSVLSAPVEHESVLQSAHYLASEPCELAL